MSAPSPPIARAAVTGMEALPCFCLLSSPGGDHQQDCTEPTAQDAAGGSTAEYSAHTSQPARGLVTVQGAAQTQTAGAAGKALGSSGHGWCSPFVFSPVCPSTLLLLENLRSPQLGTVPRVRGKQPPRSLSIFQPISTLLIDPSIC